MNYFLKTVYNTHDNKYFVNGQEVSFAFFMGALLSMEREIKTSVPQEGK